MTFGQIIIWDILDIIQKSQVYKIGIQFHCVLAHTDITINKKVNKIAKESISWCTQTKKYG